MRSLVCAGLVLSAAPAAGQEANGSERSVLDGVFSTTQASRGRATFSSVCAECHTSGQFRGASFQASWAGRSVASFFELLRTTMPNDDPGRLTRDEYAAVIAYLLQLNGYPAGERSLPVDAAALARIRFEARADSAPRARARPRPRPGTGYE